MRRKMSLNCACDVVLVHRHIDLIALPHFGRTERALTGYYGPNEVCSFSPSFLTLLSHLRLFDLVSISLYVLAPH
jgi:hypothetical protein